MRIKSNSALQIAALFAAFSLSSCASSGNETIKNETSTTIDQKIQDGQTTKDQVRSMFGDPMETTFTDSGHEEWKYQFQNATVDASNFIPVYGDLHQSTHGNTKHLTVIFNGNLVWHHSMNTSAVKTSAGLF